MHTTNLRKVGGSIMLAVPRDLLDILRLQPEPRSASRSRAAGSVVEPQPRPRYTLDELLAQCDATSLHQARENASGSMTSRAGARDHLMKRGEIWLVGLDPTEGHEQKGRRRRS